MTSSTMRNGIVVFLGTASVAVAGFSLVRYLRSWLRRVVSRNLEQKIEDAISNHDLAELAKSPNVGLRQSAEQMLLDRITRRNAFLHVLASCASSDEETALKACTALCVILKSVDQRVFQVDLHILRTLTGILRWSMDRERHFVTHMDDTDFPERMQRMTLATLYDLSSDSGFLKKLEQVDNKDIIHMILTLAENSRNKEVQRYVLLLLLQLTMHGKNFTSMKSFGIIAEKCVAHHGDIMLQKICFQLLVTMLNAQNRDVSLYLHEIAKHMVIVPAVVSTKSEDVEISFWSVALLHEFAVHNVCRKELCSLPYLVKNLQTTLMASEAGVQRLILRVLSFLALRNDSFKAELLRNKPLIGHLPTCLASGNRDVVHWALVLVHDMAMTGQPALEALLDNTNDAIVKSLLMLSTSRDNVLIRLLAETLGFFCGCERLHHRLVKAGSLEMILGLAQSQDPDLVFWASALLLNLAMTSDAVKAEILSVGGLRTLIDLSLGDHDNSQITTMAAKTLVMMAVLDEPIHLHVRCDSDSSSVVVHKKTLQLTHAGVNVVLWETLLEKRLQVWRFSPGDAETVPDTSELVNIPILEQQSSRTSHCNIAIFTINGTHSPICLRALSDQFHFDHYSRSGLMTPDPLELSEGQSCCIVAMVDEVGRNNVMHIAKSHEPVDVQLQISGALIVNQRMRQLILHPLLHRIMGVPANSPINRVTDLELLEVLVRHEAHKQLVIECHSVIDQLTAMVHYCAQQGVDQLKSEPLAVAHSHGALRVLRVLSIFDHYRPLLLTADTVPTVVNLLNGLVNFWLSAILASQGQVGSRPASRLTSRPVSRAGFRPGDSSDLASLFSSRPQSRGAASAFGLGDEILTEEDLGSTTESLVQIERDIAQAVSAISNTVQQLNSTQPPTHSRRLRSSSDSAGTEQDLAAEIEETEDKTEEGQMTNRLAKFAVLTLAHLLNTQDKGLTAAVQSSLHMSGAIHALWAALLCSSDPLKSTLALPASIAMTTLSATEFPPCPTNVVTLDATNKTPALLISADCLEVRNDSWTFESTRATVPVPSHRIEDQQHPLGWYYEAELKSCGIIQLGWATKECQYGPEKGVGVGDDQFSCAYDGARCRKWSGPITATLNNEYGMEWQVGNIVSCLLDRHGNVSFWLRGVNMGVAFKGLDLRQGWYPACSLSTDQQIKFNFGDSPFRYADLIPDGYIPFCRAHMSMSSSTRKNQQVSTQITPSDLPQGQVVQDVRVSSLESQNERRRATRSADAVVSHDIEIQRFGKQPEAVRKQIHEEDMDMAMSDFGYPEMGGEAFAEMTDSPRHIAMVKIAEVDASLRHDHPLSRQAVAASATWEPVSSHIQVSGDQTGPMGMLGLLDAEGGGEAEEFQPPPSLYFEVCISDADTKSHVIGYCNTDASDQVCVVHTPDDQLLLPDHALLPCPVGPKLTIGCALLIPPGVVFFTINGQPIRRLFTFTHEDVTSQPLTPCTNSPYLNINFGQESFLYDPANAVDQKLYMAALLHDYCETINTQAELQGTFCLSGMGL